MEYNKLWKWSKYAEQTIHTWRRKYHIEKGKGEEPQLTGIQALLLILAHKQKWEE